MQKKKKLSDDKEYINKLITPIFNKVLQEDVSNSMTTTKTTFKILWRPNNYRRQIKVKEKSNSTIEKIRSAISAIPYLTFSYEPHTKMVSIKNYAQNKTNKGITIQYGKETITGIYSQNIIGGAKEIFLIEANTINDLEKYINNKKEDIEKYIDAALKQFIKEFNISLPFTKPEWSRYEDFIKGEEYIDKIPREVIIHDTYFKKVYGKGIEFKNSEIREEPTVHLKNYIKNRAIEKIAPDIADELKNTQYMVKGILETNASTSKLLNSMAKPILELNQLTLLEIKNKKMHMKVLHDMSKTLKDIRTEIRQKNLKEFM